jgi:hypothetical protein
VGKILYKRVEKNTQPVTGRTTIGVEQGVGKILIPILNNQWNHLEGTTLAIAMIKDIARWQTLIRVITTWYA